MRLTTIRQDGPEGARRAEVYEVPEFEGMTVLDAINWVRRHRDPSLANRFSCRSANACRECLAVVNGESTYTCTALAVGDVVVEPLPNRPLLCDLAVDL